MSLIANRVTSLPESETIKMAQLSRELKSQGIDIVDMSLGEPDFNTPQHIKDAAIQAIRDDFSHYPPVPGYPELKQAIVKKFKRDANLDFQENQIVVSTGAKQTLANLILSLVESGDEVLIPAPYWVSYAAQVFMAGGAMVNITTTVENDFKITAQQLEEKINNKTKVFLFSSPCNPTGSVYTHEELESLVSVFEKYPNVIIISDEIYENIVFQGKHESIAKFPSIKERVCIVNGLSKGYAMTGWRLGYMAAPLEIAKACTKMQGQFTSGANSITQRAAIEALMGDQEPSKEMSRILLRRRNLILELLQDIPGMKLNVPEGAFYVFPDISHLLGKSHEGRLLDTADEFCLALIEKAHVSLVTGNAFGSPNCIRLSYATSDDRIREAVKRLKAFILELK